MVEVHFINLEEIVQQSDEEEQTISEREELRRRLIQAGTSYRQKKELYDRILVDGLALEELTNEIVAENKKLTGRVKELQQQLANIKKKKQKQEEEEEAQTEELLFEEEEKRIVRHQSIYIKNMEKDNQKLREKNENLSVELDQLCLTEKYEDHLEKLKTTEQELEHKLEEIEEALRSKDDEIKKKFQTVVEKLNEIEEHLNNMKALRQERRELREQLRSTQEEQILAAQSSPEEPLSEKRQPLDVSAMDEEDEEQDKKTESWWHRCATILWRGIKAAGLITNCVLLSVGIMTSIVPFCNSSNPDCNLWSIIFNMLEPYSQLQHIHPPVS
ncbi:golgin subfamily A member 6-like protein 6 [Thunnus maccoyii]|uniref:golgin subfamily A member 6-like protein 6 n=1 Tax=Thunnus maccoyii TaxID=8240 RepID=UPI001C4C5326|nr:golgin subfamily A member 6-like protein 6 [Thunnus maccoyii]